MYVGMRLLGAIKEIHDLNLVVSLPYHLVGYVSIAEISEELSSILEKMVDEEENVMAVDIDSEHEEVIEKEDSILPDLRTMFRIGQQVICSVISLESNDRGKRIELTMKPNVIHNNMKPQDLYTNMLLPAVVQSVEDHGYVMGIGIEGVQGFLHHKHAKEYFEENHDGRTPQKGQIFICCIIHLTESGRVLTLSVNSNDLQKRTVMTATAMTFEVVTPGMLVQVQVKKITSHGLWVSFLDMFEGYIDALHLNKPTATIEEDNEKIRYKVNQKVSKLE
jgi:rRNA biogenesis protein RRP5